MPEMTHKDRTRAEAALKLAISRIGGVTSLAAELGLTRDAIYKWNGICSPAHVLDVEKLTNIPRTDLRPDWYPGGDS